MIEVVFNLLGGIGIFLLAMSMLTEGLKAFAGARLGEALGRFTGTPVKAFLSGALITLVVQSSTATTVTLIGFVSAGLLTFAQSVGAVMGASLGTTATGWLVSVVGLHISLGFYALPLVGIGAFLRLSKRDRWRALGLALAGFGLIFIAIAFLQDGMGNMASRIDFEGYGTDNFVHRALIVGIGIVMTVMLQSSTAAVVTTLTALHAGAVGFDQAMLLVIGAAIGTTVTGVLAAMGGTVMAKRTAVAHVVFNLASGVLALLMLPLYLSLIETMQQHLGLQPGATSLAAFHTLFIAIGVALFLPLARHYARLIEWLVPQRDQAVTQQLDDSLLQIPSLALQATQTTLADIANRMRLDLLDLLDGHRTALPDSERARLARELHYVQDFFARIPAIADDASYLSPRLSQMHAMDHLERLLSRLVAPQGLVGLERNERLLPFIDRAREALDLAALGLAAAPAPEWEPRLLECARELARMRNATRRELMQEGARGELASSSALVKSDFMRWLERSVNHVSRVTLYLHQSTEPPPDVIPD